MSFSTDARQYIEELKRNGQYRFLRNIVASDGVFMELNEQRLLNLSSNDYLGIGASKKLIDDFQNSMELNRNPLFLYGSTSSRMLSGNSIINQKLEGLLESYYKKGILVFNSGYHANTGIIPAIAGSDDLILSDKLNHASIIDGIKLSRAKFERYIHLDYNHLESFLKKYSGKYKKIIIISESIFSMDGDMADLAALVKLKEIYGALLYIDEAHALGVRGTLGLGLCEENNLIEQIDFIVGTFGKAFASTGAFVACEEIYKEYLINKCRTFIFTTGLAPINNLWTSFVLEKITSMQAQREYLRELANKLRNNFLEDGLKTYGTSHIIPIIVGESERSVEISNHLLNDGFFVLPIRPPTVPKNTARFRISLSAAMNWEVLKNLSSLLKREMNY